MRCLLTGARGQLGTELSAWLKGGGEEVVGWDLPAHDVTDVERTINGIHKVGPDVIYHLAAWTDVDGCEKDPGRAAAVNFQGTWSVALGAAELGCKLLYVSTDYVFDGTKRTPYRERDEPNPLSVYGRSKLMGETAVTKTCKRAFVVRTSWLYGQAGRNFVDTIRDKAQRVHSIQVVDDQVGSPTWARDLCEPLHVLASTEKFGFYHLCNSGQCSWCELARAIVELTGADCEVRPSTTEEAGRPAPRPAFSVLGNRNFRTRLGVQLRPWQDALKEYLG